MPNDKIKLELSIDHVNVILEALGALPFAKVYELIHSIQEQAQAQLNPTEANSQANNE